MTSLITETDKVMRHIPVDYRNDENESDKRCQKHVTGEKHIVSFSHQEKYYQQVEQLDNELRSLNEISVSMENQLKTADQLVKELKGQLEAGIIQMTEYINANKNFKSISRNLNMINIQKLQVINEMNFLLTK